jgi:NTP pyrophosphatase (non-canonical NTP hydrolase)
MDDIILKAVQESYEFTEALEQNDSSNSIKEAGDLLINILSVTSRFGDIDKLSLDSSLANEM